MDRMNRSAREALLMIRACVAAKRYVLKTHFRLRMAERGLLWTDVLTILDAPGDVRSGGRDDFDRAKWLVSGSAVDGEPIEFVCVLDVDARGEVTVFVTIY
jgi:hypothetical protein